MDTIEDVLQWIRGNVPTATFALPYHLFGPDLMGWIRCDNDPPILQLKQDRSHMTGNKNTMDATTLSDAIDSMAPESWFTSAVRFKVVSF